MYSRYCEKNVTALITCYTRVGTDVYVIIKYLLNDKKNNLTTIKNPRKKIKTNI